MYDTCWRLKSDIHVHDVRWMMYVGVSRNGDTSMQLTLQSTKARITYHVETRERAIKTEVGWPYAGARLIVDRMVRGIVTELIDGKI